MHDFGYTANHAAIAFELEDYYVWDCAVIYAEGKYHMFSSRWKKELGFGWNWIYNSEIIQSVSDNPEGPYQFLRVILPRRGRAYFDGMNTHNTCIRYFNGKFYLYYMGTSYGGEIPQGEETSPERNLEVWNRKRIGVAVADSIYGEFLRRERPLLSPRDCSHWDCTITTNPAVAILPSGKTYLVYKSRRAVGEPLMLGVAVAEQPDGEFQRLSDEPILTFDDSDFHVEDPFLWYDAGRKKFCLLAKEAAALPVNGAADSMPKVMIACILKFRMHQRSIPVISTGRTDVKHGRETWSAHGFSSTIQESQIIFSVQAVQVKILTAFREERLLLHRRCA